MAPKLRKLNPFVELLIGAFLICVGLLLMGNNWKGTLCEFGSAIGLVVGLAGLFFISCLVKDWFFEYRRRRDYTAGKTTSRPNE